MTPYELENLRPYFDQSPHVYLDNEGAPFKPPPFASLNAFRKWVESIFKRHTEGHPEARQIILTTFRMHIAVISQFWGNKRNRLGREGPRDGPASSERRDRLEEEHKRVPSGATLIIVPDSLLEHWYEQLSRLLGMDYLAHSRTEEGEEEENAEAGDDDSEDELDEDGRQGRRGMCYFDGFGDICDIVPPVSLTNKDYNALLDKHRLSNYLIVVTTYKRCAQEYQKNRVIGVSQLSLLTVRWLRLIVDEGHELGQEHDKVCHCTSQNNYHVMLKNLTLPPAPPLPPLHLPSSPQE